MTSSFEPGPVCAACGEKTVARDNGYYNEDGAYTCAACAACAGLKVPADIPDAYFIIKACVAEQWFVLADQNTMGQQVPLLFTSLEKVRTFVSRLQRLQGVANEFRAVPFHRGQEVEL